jgi:hypothetical protein
VRPVHGVTLFVAAVIAVVVAFAVLHFIVGVIAFVVKLVVVVAVIGFIAKLLFRSSR